MKLNENRRMKPVEIVLRRGRRKRKNNGEVNLIKVCCRHM
jgi:hypothetical protein